MHGDRGDKGVLVRGPVRTRAWLGTTGRTVADGRKGLKEGRTGSLLDGLPDGIRGPQSPALEGVGRGVKLGEPQLPKLKLSPGPVGEGLLAALEVPATARKPSLAEGMVSPMVHDWRELGIGQLGKNDPHDLDLDHLCFRKPVLAWLDPWQSPFLQNPPGKWQSYIFDLSHWIKTCWPGRKASKLTLSLS